MKKFLSLVVAALLTVSAVATSATAAKFTDVDATNEALNEAVELLVTLGVTKGTSDTTFGTDENVTRQQMAAFMYRMMKAGKSVENGENLTSFTDLDDPTFYYMISWANELGIIKGRSTTTFDPKGGIVLQDAYTMIVRALGYDDGSLSYPIGYIEEAERLGLDENLDSTINYSDNLTRGDVAIILANMFYAETAEVKVGYATTAPDANGMTTTYPIEYHETLAESVFKVTKDTYRVVATKSYALGAADQQTSAVDMVVLEDLATGNTTPVMLADLGLEGTSDDYFLLDLSIYVKDGKIFSASALGTKETVDASEVIVTKKQLKNIKTNRDEWFISEALTIKGVETYIVDAPYSYAGDVDGGFDDANLKFLNITASGVKGQVDYQLVDFQGYVDTYITSAGWTNNPSHAVLMGLSAGPSANFDNGLLYNMARGGLGEYDVYDSNGDGKYDYILVKPYVVGTIDTTASKSINDTVAENRQMVKLNPATSVLYTAEATVDAGSAEFANKDVVLAFVDLDGNYIKVAEVLKPTVATVASASANSYKFADDTEISYANASLAIYNGGLANIITSLDAATSNMGVERNYYMYNGQVLYSTAKAAAAPAGFDPTTAWAIVLGTDTENHLIGTKIETVNVAKAFIDGKVQTVKIKAADAAAVAALENVLATAKVDKDGYYTFTADTTVDKGALTDKEKDSIKVVKGSTTTTITKNANGSFALAGEALTGVYALEGAQFIIRSKDAEGNVIVNAYTADTLPAIAQTFTSASYVLTNNVNSTKYENVGVFYGYYNGVIGAAGATATKNMVLMGGISNAALVDHDNNPDTAAMVERTYMTYELGAKPAAVTGKNLNATYSAVFGDLFVLDSEGELDDTAKIGNLFGAGNMYKSGAAITSGYGYKKIDNFDPTSKLVELNGESGEYYLTKNTVISLAKKGNKSITMSKVDALTELKADGTTYANTLSGSRAAFVVYEETTTAGVYNIVNLVIVVD